MRTTPAGGAPPSGSPVSVASQIVRSAVVGGSAGLVAGVVVAGIGGRLVMRLSALLDPAARQTGLITENGNRVGEITVDGTLGLIIFTGLFSGLAAGFIWVAVRPWIAGSRRSWLAAGLAAMAIGGFFVIDADNSDFGTLAATGINVAMFMALAFLLGALVVPLDRWFDRVLPRGLDTPAMTLGLYLVPASIGGAVTIPLTIGAMLDSEMCFCANPPWPMGIAFLLTVLVTGASWVHEIRAGRIEPPTGRTRIIGRTATASTAGLGIAYLTGEILQMF